MKKIVKTIIMILLMVAVGAVHAYGQWKQPVYDTTVDAAEYQNVGEISGTAKIEQEFTAEYNGMNGLFVRTSTWGRVNDSKMTYELVNIKDDSVIAEGVLKVSEVTDNDYKEITFPEVKEREKSIALQLQQMESTTEKESVFLRRRRQRVQKC